MEYPTFLIQTKLHRPPLPIDLVPRPRLTAWLDRDRLRPLTLVSAPAGFGKTTLVSAWLQQAGRPFAWLSLDEGDDDPARFLAHVACRDRGAAQRWRR